MMLARSRWVLVVPALALAAACAHPTRGGAPPSTHEAFARREAASDCATRVRTTDVASVARDLGATDASPQAVARAYAAVFAPGLPRAIEAGCLEGITSELEGVVPPRLATRAAAARGTGCSAVRRLPDEGRRHLRPDEVATYKTSPAASGPHDERPLPPNVDVYSRPVSEARAVHNLEHGYVLIHVRQTPRGDADVLTALGTLARHERKVILAPYPGLPEETAFALVAWTRLQFCGDVSSTDAAAVAKAFILRFREAGAAPSPQDP